ncbi:hypothetical protein GFH30_06325 [Acinetobacter wanghuae]|uniref:Bacteriophage lambda Replication protein O N-terminal domain-containing protein n=1 Tax=Acinetobacter wanghuae TaxID=2662362 RepID=A0ABX6D3F1_9GAMM|nr:replication protein [Acinetobacter wanghuae]QGA12300.1 hypothetical protein GFH30_06325 [Acinetobacter wanghuae]
MLPNDLIDKGYMAEMKGPALACYLFIVRKTRGWNKDSDAISVSQLVKGTKYNKDSVLKGCEKLVQMGVIERAQFANQPAKYTITDYIFAVENLDSENIASENLDSRVENIDSVLSKKSTHNNKPKTTNTKTKVVIDKSDSKPCLTHSKNGLSLSEKQASVFASKLSDHAEFCSMHAQTGESHNKFVSRLKMLLRTPGFAEKNLSYLEDVGFKRGGA